MGAKFKDKIMAALSHVRDDEIGRDIVSLGMISGYREDKDGNIVFLINVDSKRGAALEPLRQAAEKAAMNVRGVHKVTAILTAEKPVENMPVPDPHGMNKNPPLALPAHHVIAIASGKGGVGKSTVAANIAAGLVARGMRVGLLDADIYGPSQPTMMGDVTYKPAVNSRKKLEPLIRHGIKIMSMGFLADQAQALIWRGPMVQTAFYQMLRDVAWADINPDTGAEEKLDYLIIDMPPGTGDVQLTLAQKVTLDGAVIVSTPQDIALIDARRAVFMFKKTNVPVLGIIENMSTYICQNCGHEAHIFGHGGARAEAKKLGVPFLGEIPLSMDIREKSDAGEPLACYGSDNFYSDIIAKIMNGTT